MISTLVDESNSATVEIHADRLQARTTAVRLHIRWPGTRKTLSRDQTEQAAGAFDADSRSLSAAKRLFDTKHPAPSASSRRSRRKRSRIGKGSHSPTLNRAFD